MIDSLGFDTSRPVYLLDPVNYQHPLNQGRALWWLTLPGLDGGNTFFDLMGLHHGTLTNMGVGSGWGNTTQPGGYGCIALDGTDDYISTQVNIGSFADAGSLAIWALPQNTYNSGVREFVFGTVNPTDIWEFCFQHFTDNNMYVGWNSSSGGDTRIVVAADSTNWTKSWQRYVVTWTNGGLTALYRNGVLIGTHSGTATFTRNTLLTIGREDGSLATFYFFGNVNDISLWNRALSATEVQADYDLSRLGYPGVLNRIGPCAYPSNVAVRNLSIVLNGSSQPVLTWSAEPNTNGYKVYRSSTSLGDATLLTTLGSGTLTYTDTTTSGGTYYYEVVATFTAPQTAPDLTITFNGSGQPVLTWTAVAGAVKYKVYGVSTQNGDSVLLSTVTPPTVTYTDTSALVGNEFYEVIPTF